MNRYVIEHNGQRFTVEAPDEASAMEAVNGYRAPSATDAFAQGALQGVTLNTGDEIYGAAAASGIPQSVTSALGGGPIAQAVGSMTRIPAAIGGAGRLAAEAIAPGMFGTAATERYRETTDAVRREMDAGSRAHPVASFAGNIVGGMAIPIAGAASRPGTMAERFARGGLVGAGMGAAYGAGDGTDAASRASGAATGLLIGGLLGGATNAALGPRVAQPRPSTAGPAAQEVAQAADRLGVQLPMAVATDSMTAQRLGAGVRNVPVLGNSLVTASQRAMGQLNDAANDLANGMGAVARDQAGMTAATAIRDWTTRTSRDLVRKAYDDVDRAIANPSQTAPLSATSGAVANILARRGEGALPGAGGAVDLVAEALQRPGGLTYQGIKTLRTSVGEMLDNALTPAGISQGELRQIYGALSEDLRTAAQISGGDRALQLFERANRTNQLVQGRREELARIIGKNGEASSEQVFDRLLTLASDRSGGNLSRLAQARRTMDPDEWREVGATLISRMGRNAEGDFTPDRFFTAWGQLSDAGKNLLFGGSGNTRQALDDLATVSSRFRQLQQYGNPSGTAQNMGVQALVGGGTVGSLFVAPVPVITSVVGTATLANILAAPATATSLARWARAYEVAVARPSAGSVAALQSASRNFAATIGERLGVTVDPMDFLRAIQGAQPVRAENENEQRQ